MDISPDTKRAARRVLDRAREGFDVDPDDITVALRILGDITDEGQTMDDTAQHTARQMELRGLMQEHSLTYQQVAELAGVSVKLVERWLADPAAKSNSPIRRPYLDLIKLRLKGR